MQDQKSPKKIHLHTIAQLCRAISSQFRYVSTIRKKLVKQQYLLQTSPQYGELRLTNGWDRLEGLGHSSKFQRLSCLGYVTAATSLPEANQTLHDVCPSPELLHYVYIFSGAFAPWRNFSRCKLHFASKFCILLYWQHYCTALDQWTSAKLCGVHGTRNRITEFRRRRHLCSAGRPSRWASAHILVVFISLGAKEMCMTTDARWCHNNSEQKPPVFRLAGRSGPVVTYTTAPCEMPGSNPTADDCVYHDNYCDIQPSARLRSLRQVYQLSGPVIRTNCDGGCRRYRSMTSTMAMP